MKNVTQWVHHEMPCVRDRREYRYRIEKPYSDTDTWYQYQYRLGAYLSPGISPGIDWELF